jgi:DNA repair protein RecO (recombination protein O)
LDSTLAIVLRKVKLTESSVIISWLTESSGVIRTVAKGARKPKSRFAGTLDLFYECEIQFSRSRTGDLHGLREAVLRDTRENIRQDYYRVTLAGYFVQLLELVMEPDHPSPELYDLLRRALNHLNETPATMRALEHFERQLTQLIGIGRSSADPAAAIAQTYHRLPPSRRDLARALG